MTGATHGVGENLISACSRLELEGPLGLLASLSDGEASAGIPAAAAGTLGTLGAVPTSRGDLLQTHAVDVVATVAQVTEQHFVLVRVVVTL